jgi:hypothetical protein
MRIQVLTVTLSCLTTLTPVGAGCIGPVIMGKCQGQAVDWDTHSSGYQEPRPAGAGFYWDKRGTPQAQQQPGAVNPFTGQDAHDSRWGSGDGDAIPRGGYR